jgi:Pyruvate/2-oxoacid:ferredoxin oxidoreductase delta subunit
MPRIQFNIIGLQTDDNHSATNYPDITVTISVVLQQKNHTKCELSFVLCIENINDTPATDTAYPAEIQTTY